MTGACLMTKNSQTPGGKMKPLSKITNPLLTPLKGSNSPNFLAGKLNRTLGTLLELSITPNGSNRKLLPLLTSNQSNSTMKTSAQLPEGLQTTSRKEDALMVNVFTMQRALASAATCRPLSSIRSYETRNWLKKKTALNQIQTRHPNLG